MANDSETKYFNTWLGFKQFVPKSGQQEMHNLPEQPIHQERAFSTDTVCKQTLTTTTCDIQDSETAEQDLPAAKKRKVIKVIVIDCLIE